MSIDLKPINEKHGEQIINIYNYDSWRHRIAKLVAPAAHGHRDLNNLSEEYDDIERGN